MLEGTIDCSKHSLRELERFGRVVYAFFLRALEAYRKGDATARHFLEFGVPVELLKLLKTSDVEPHLLMLRFDFFMTASGYKLIEIASNPWGLISYEGFIRDTNWTTQFPALSIYEQLCKQRRANSIGIWQNFGILSEVERLVDWLGRKGYLVRKLTPDKADEISECDTIFFDIDTAYFDGSLKHLGPYVTQLAPSVTNEVIKRKNMLALLYAAAQGVVGGPLSMNDKDAHFVNRFMVSTVLLDGQYPPDFTSGAVKNVVGLWGEQVSVFPSPGVGVKGKRRARRCKAFQRDVREALRRRNAIAQSYIDPIRLKCNDISFLEFSVVFGKRGAFPFVRVFSGHPEERRLRGLMRVRLFEAG